MMKRCSWCDAVHYGDAELFLVSFLSGGQRRLCQRCFDFAHTEKLIKMAIGPPERSAQEIRKEFLELIGLEDG